MLTKEEAKNIYLEASAICLNEEEMKQLCADKGVPQPWLAEFMQEEQQGDLLVE